MVSKSPEEERFGPLPGHFLEDRQLGASAVDCCVGLIVSASHPRPHVNPDLAGRRGNHGQRRSCRSLPAGLLFLPRATFLPPLPDTPAGERLSSNDRGVHRSCLRHGKLGGEQVTPTVTPDWQEVSRRESRACHGRVRNRTGKRASLHWGVTKPLSPQESQANPPVCPVGPDSASSRPEDAWVSQGSIVAVRSGGMMLCASIPRTRNPVRLRWRDGPGLLLPDPRDPPPMLTGHACIPRFGWSPIAS